MYLSPELYVGFIKLQADKSLGRSYAALLPFIEGLYSLGYITQEVYEVHKKRYSSPLLAQKTLPEILDPQTEQLNKAMGMAADQWDLHHNVEWRRDWINTATLHPELPNSKLILAKQESLLNKVPNK
jgi:hypothetical protein